MGLQSKASFVVVAKHSTREPTAIPRVPESPATLSEIVVVTTSERGTRAALSAAARLATISGRSIRLIVPEVVAFSLAYEMPPVQPEYLRERLWFSLSKWRVSIQVQIILCNDQLNALKRTIRQPSLIFLGGLMRAWWPTEEQRLAGFLRLRGHEVVFVGQE